MNIEEYADREMLVINLANKIAGEIRNCLLHHEFASFAVPGGTTPGPIFDALCSVDLDWSRVHVLLTDERWVPEENARSNTALVRERLLTERAAAATFVPFYRDGLSAAEAAPEIAEALAPELPVSVLLLGMGEDMHTASLFPGAPGLSQALDPDAPAVVAVSPDSQPEERISLSGPVLDGAMSKHLVIFGQAKRDALERAATLSGEDAPIGAVIGGGTVHWAA
ncbi:6-phosphogluconolactonase [Sulfitobacter sp. D35]|uniref:6-phosphogluconolactonase n=1 Tax=Sulfitobacter sp. D35 TaxID=3083252 RepID=UPI00296FEA72|nr:6-phosphogluconolactonase [Sulfitobacter sp. D35]MDW4497826.1 6-phosphogluconolactonase [Sulfitobacter sp. D35]